MPLAPAVAGQLHEKLRHQPGHFIRLDGDGIVEDRGRKGRWKWPSSVGGLEMGRDSRERRRLSRRGLVSNEGVYGQAEPGEREEHGE